MSQLKDLGNTFVDAVNDIVKGAGNNFEANADINSAKAAAILGNAAVQAQEAQDKKAAAERQHKLIQTSIVGVLVLVGLAIVLFYASKFIKK